MKIIPNKEKEQIEYQLTRDDIVAELWRRGQLSFLLQEHQHQIYDAIWAAIIGIRNDPNHYNKYYVNCSRRLGKTTIDCIVAIEMCLRDSRRHIRFASCTAKELENAVHPIMQQLLDTCPDEIKPKFKDGAYHFRNGSAIHIAGVNNKHEDDLRGSNSHLNIVDEAAFVDNLKYLLNSVLVPQTLTTNGLTIITTTPAVSPDHDSKIYYDEAVVNNAMSEFTIHANTSLSKEKIDSIARDCGGVKSTDFQREYECKWVVDSDLDIIPEWNDKYIEAYNADARYQFYHKYTAMDLGINDLTAILYAVYDFTTAKLHILSEDVINGPDMTTEKVAKLVVDKEKQLWNTWKVYDRISDSNNPLMLQDLNAVYNLLFRATTKDNLDAMINKVRLFVDQGRLIVHPSCLQLLGCLKYGVWQRTSKKREFARSSVYGHYDALAALVYLIRNIDESTNPVPPIHDWDNNNTHFGKDFNTPNESANVQTFKKIFNRK